MPKIPSQVTSTVVKEADHVLNGKVLDVAQWAASINTIHPSLHRLLNASFLTAGLFGGRTMMNLLTGETYSGQEIPKEDVSAPLKPLHGILAYNHFSDQPSDRWMRVMDLWFPAALGAVGAVAGSHVFALDQTLVRNAKEALKAPEKLTLDVAESASVMTQAKPWRVLSGVTSLFGSAAGFQLIPGPTNYGSTLSASFLGAVERNKLHTPYMPWLQEFITANKHPYAYGPTSMLSKFREYLVHNPEKDLKQAQKMAYAILEPWFGVHATPEKIEKFVEHVTSVRNKFIQEGGVPEHLQEQVHKELERVMHGLGFEKTLEKIGLDPAEATIGRNGFMEYFSRILGYDKTLNRISEQYRLGYLKRTDQIAKHITELAPHDEHMAMRWAGRGIAAASAAAVGAGAINAQYWHKRDNDNLLRRAIGKQYPQTEEGQEYAEELESLKASKEEVETTTFSERLKRDHNREHHSHNRGLDNPVTRAINDKPLAIMEWGADALNSPKTHGMHRVYCAAGLSLGGFIGMKLMDVLTGRNLFGKVVTPEEVPNFMMGMYKKLAYNPHSDHPKDRWGYVVHFLVPALSATAGVIGASSHFFKDKVTKVSKAQYIDEFEIKATMDEAGPWTGLTALTSLFVTPSGFSFLPPPFPNYGTSLGTRFNLSAGRKVILPIVGDVWTGTESRYPYGPPRLVDHMIRYAVNNPDHHPEQLEEMAIGVLKPWFKNVSKEQVEEFIRHVEEDRNQFLQCGGIPEELKSRAENQLKAHFKGAGLEQTLREIGLDPAEATLGNNGLSGKIAEYLGGGDALAQTRADFKRQYAERQQNPIEQKAHDHSTDDKERILLSEEPNAKPSTTLSETDLHPNELAKQETETGKHLSA